MGSNPSSRANEAKRVQRREKAFELRLQGWSLRQIAEELKVSHTTVKTDLQEELDQRMTPLADEERKRQLDQIDMLIKRVSDILADEPILVQHGKVVYGPDKEPLIDRELYLKCMDRLCRLLDQRARLTGAYKPQEVEQTVKVANPVDDAIMNLVNEMQAKNAAEREKL